MKKANFSLSEDTLEKLTKFSEATMIPKSRIVDKAISEYIEDNKALMQLSLFTDDTDDD